MKVVIAIVAAVGSAIVCGPAAAIFAEMLVLPLFYSTSYESAVSWGAVYVAGPAGLIIGLVSGAWLVLRRRVGETRAMPAISRNGFVHE